MHEAGSERSGLAAGTAAGCPEPVIDYAALRAQPMLLRSVWSEPQALEALEECRDALIKAYFDVNLNLRPLPLKELLWGLERQLLLACLNLTRGSQKNAAVLLGVRTTTLFEKMRKFGLNPRRQKLAERLQMMPGPEE